MNETLRAPLIGRHKPALTVAAAVAAAIAPMFFSQQIRAQEAPAEELEEVVVSGDRLNVMQTTPVDSVFGFGKTVVDTPRSLTTISAELLSKSLITEIDDLVALSPGSFTQSFFGVAGSLDVRGTPGETYFRGIKRIDNPGNYPTPIGASDRIDIVRGPASPIYGPSKIGGYLNFVPKSARASTGKYLSEPTAEIGVTVGSFDKRVLHGEVGGPMTMMGKEMGYYLYGESENSGSYYQNTAVEQSIVQASFDVKVTDTWRAEFGGMYQYFKGNQVAGWNRLTQDLIDNGTYITGSPRALDTNGNGLLSTSELDAGNVALGYFAPVGVPSVAAIAADIATHPNMALLNPGTAHIEGDQVLVQEDDNLEDDVFTAYFDLVGEFSENFSITNKLFFESLNNNNENAYGFSQYAKTWVAEEQFIVAFKTNFGDAVSAAFQLSPSIRHQDFEHGDDFFYEFFDRRDITLPGSPIDRRELATRGFPFYSNNTVGNFTDYGIAGLADLAFFEKLHVTAGLRYDYVDMKSTRLTDPVPAAVDDTDGGVSWSVSVGYDLPFGIRPYVTVAEQNTLVLGQGGEINPNNITGGTAVASSDLREYGVKANLLDNHMFVAVDYYEQKRVDNNAQDLVTNNTTQAKGYELELRYVVNPMLTVTGAFTHSTILNLTATERGGQFSYVGAGDLPGVNPASFFGGYVQGDFPTVGNVYKAGIPENLGSINLLLGFDAWVKGLSSTIGVTHVSSVAAGLTRSIILPSYTLVNAGIRYESGPSWSVGLQVKNLTDERYFRSNFPDLFGSNVVLPEVPRNVLITASYKF